MKESILYILQLRDEPLVKIGLTSNLSVRVLKLNGRFDLARSYMVQAKDRKIVALLETNLKTLFADRQQSPATPMRNGNTETFHADVLPEVLKIIGVFQKEFAGAGIHLSDLQAPGYVTNKRLTLDLQPELHRRLKAWCATHETTMLDAITQLLEEKFPSVE